MRNLFFLGCAIFCLTAIAKAGPVEVDFVRAELPPDSTTLTSPAFMGPVGDVSTDNVNDVSVGTIVFLKFKIPDISDIVSVNSFNIYLAFYDDGDGGGESGDVDFALPGNNIKFLATFTSLNHTTVQEPALLEIQLTPDEINQVFPTITDGTFRIRISRDTGDFYTFPFGAATMDAVLASDLTTPEPSSVSAMTAGLSALGLLLYFRKRSSSRS